MKGRNFYPLFLSCLVVLTACRKRTQELTEQQIVSAWADMTLYLTQYTPANSPTYASRAIGYSGLTMYESVVHGYPEYQSVQSQLNGLEELPKPETSKDYNWLASFNAAQAEILHGLYMQTSDENKLKIDSLENHIYKSLRDNADVKAVENGATFGKNIALAIYEWSKTDGGHRAYLHNFDKELKHPEFPGSWKPPLYAQSFSHHPLHPYWGENRTFLKKNDNLKTPKMIRYNPSKGSAYYKQYLAVYEQDKALTQEDKEVAIWWGDDPDDTFTPPGHSFYMASKAVEHYDKNLIESAMTYARVGMAVADAFRNCWKWKYHFFSERPNTFIPEFIDEEWESFWPDPPFPAFPSGHAINAGAMATVLENLYEPFTFTDSSHVNRERDHVRDVDFKPRTFNSFWEAAQETADSRFYGGIHCPQDNEVGLEEGKRIAQNVNNLQWKK
ncbi:vanadium-dependent haloperoxidase [Jiulongibacter sp. NS-SX5]|uniref:vanadium-dependent haloperoxidase n=1 Tax=Jiulongibacter sp. NS-SX5 TaxID=3463854 RepID=UPI00405965D7